MLTLLFVVGLIWMVWKVAFLGFRLTWGLVKLLFTTVLFPIILVGIFIAGLAYVALPVLIIVGIIALIAGRANTA